MMVRTQITLDAATHRRAKRKAAELGVSLSELARRAFARELDEREAPRGDITAIFDLGNSRGSDVARHKDQYLAEATRRDYLRKTGRAPEDQ